MSGQNPPFPPETFGNLLLLYCKPQHAFYDLALDVKAEYSHLVNTHLTKDLFDYLNAAILRQTSPQVCAPQSETGACATPPSVRTHTPACKRRVPQRTSRQIGITWRLIRTSFESLTSLSLGCLVASFRTCA